MAPPRTVVTTASCNLLLIYLPRKDEKLSWPSWLTYSGWFTHISGHPSAVGRAQDSDSSPVKDQRSTAESRNSVIVTPQLMMQLIEPWAEQVIQTGTAAGVKCPANEAGSKLSLCYVTDCRPAPLVPLSFPVCVLQLQVCPNICNANWCCLLFCLL